LAASLAALIGRLWRSLSLEGNYALHVGALVVGVLAAPISVGVFSTTRDTRGSETKYSPTVELQVVAAEIAVVDDVIQARGGVDLSRTVSEVDENLPGLSSEPIGAIVHPIGVSDATSPSWQRVAPWLAAMYGLGVLLMFARLGRGVIRVGRLRRRSRKLEEGPAARALQRLVEQWQMRARPYLAEAERIAVPTVVGFVKPAILLPSSALSGLTPTELEMIIAHELAHVRRCDQWINLFQRLAEVAYFFNPGVWYLSRRISTLREYCCDEFACRRGTTAASRLDYASALLRVVELACPKRAAFDELAALAASGRSPSELRRRVARLFGEPLREPLPITRTGVAVIAAVTLILLVIPAPRPQAAEGPEGVTLHFPADRAVGVVFTRPESAGGFGWGQDHWAGWNPTADAQGDVRIPAGQHVRLDISKNASTDLSFLAELPTDAIDWLQLEGTDLNDEGLAYVGRLTGLRRLILEETRITDAGVKHLAGLDRLQAISFSAFDVDRDGFGIGDDALATIAILPALESIDLRRTKVTDDGMARLAAVKSLRSVSIPGTAVTDAGLLHLARLPHLEALRLGVYDEGADVTDDGMRIVGRMTGLKSLGLSGTKVGDEGLKHLAPLVNLEFLDIDETQVTIEGLAALAPLTGLRQLGASSLRGGSIDDRAAAHLAKLPQLESISANMELSNEGAIALSKAPRLEYVSLRDTQITDDCCAALAAMPRLKKLWFQGCPITDAGLELLSRSSTLEYLLINDAAITSDGLRHLKKLPKLINLSIDFNVQEDRSPDEHPTLKPIGELTGLTSLDVDGFDGAEIKHLAALKGLTRLEFGDETVADDASLATIGQLEELTSLTINGSTATDAGMKALSRLKKLDYLQISCLATDEGLAALHDLQTLRMVQIASPYFTKGGLDRLAANVPALQEINKYDFRLYGSEVTPSVKDAFFRRGAPEERGDRDALEDQPPPPLDVARWVNVAEGNRNENALADLRGKVVLVHFWGAWCGPCRAQQPALAALYKKYADQGLEVVGVHTTDSAEGFDEFVEQHTIEWPEAVDRDERTTDAWGVTGYPSYYLIDRQGNLRFADLFRRHLEAAVVALIAEPAPDDPE
jgi:beta-lactamase regulating signal transducer with metallopeptidase domain/thiol-disulfide isomerase/thioredoxin